MSETVTINAASLKVLLAAARAVRAVNRDGPHVTSQPAVLLTNAIRHAEAALGREPSAVGRE